MNEEEETNYLAFIDWLSKLTEGADVVVIIVGGEDDSLCEHCRQPIIESWALNDDGSNVWVHADTGDDACEGYDDRSCSATPMGTES